MAKMTLKPEMIKAFDGQGDVEAWLAKAELVARLTAVEDLASFLPLFLEGGALAVYMEMGPEEKKDIDCIKKSLREAFADNDFRAFVKLKDAKWLGEPVDVFANELRRLARLCGLEGEGLEQVVKLAFVTGFPDVVSLELQQMAGVAKMRVADLIGRARILASNSNRGCMEVAAPALGNSADKDKDRRTVKCYLCGGPHFVRECKEKKRSIICFRCGGEGHIAIHCERGNSSVSRRGGQRNDYGQHGAACASINKCPRTKGIKGVPVIMVTVAGRGCFALVDTGCSNTMIRSGLVEHCTGEVMTKAFDGRTVRCKGSTDVELEVAGEKVSTKATVVDTIIGDMDMVIGMDVVDMLGGVSVGDKTVQFGLLAKPAERLDGGTAMRNSDGKLIFGRNRTIPTVDHNLSRRELFSICGKLVGHYPVVGWLRLACSFVKRRSQGTRWSDYIGDEAQKTIADIIDRVQREDPVRGFWGVERSTKGLVWCDASSLAIGVVLEIGEIVVEDGAWMRKSDDYHHINVAKMEAVLKGINLGIKWGLQDITVMTDSATVNGWLSATLSEERRIKTSGAAEILVKRRLSTLKALIKEVGITLQVQLVSSKGNKADALTRVKKEWLARGTDPDNEECASVCVKELHDQHHMGVERTWYMAKQVDPTIMKNDVKRVVRKCELCSSIDPHPIRHDVGNLDVDKPWERLAVDVTHYRGTPYLTMVDCGPGRFVIWRKLKNETAQCVVMEMEQVFFERGPVSEVLLDNGASFRSELFTNFLGRWNVHAFYRAAYRPSGNGIVERNHRTIKAMAERGNVSPIEAVYYYNSSPKYRQEEDSIPQRSVFMYEWRLPMMNPMGRETENPRANVRVGEEVWVKPPGARCTTQWKRGVVTGVHSSNNVEVDNVPRHVLDIRRARDTEGDVEVDETDPVSVGDEAVQRHSRRDRRLPVWMGDYETE